MVKKIDDHTGKTAIKTYITHLETTQNTNQQNKTNISTQTPTPIENPTNQTIATIVRYSLQKISQQYPGKSVEIRIPPYGATQILQGTSHTRGTPPAVVETDPHTWINLILGKTTWEKATQTHKIHATGQRSNLEKILPLNLE